MTINLQKPKLQFQIDVETKSRKWSDPKNCGQHKIAEFIIKSCKKIILHTELVKILDKNSLVQLSVSLVSNAQIKKINYQFRGKNKPTDILSFSALDEKIIQKQGLLHALESPQFVVLGDLVLAYETIQKDAELQNKSFNHHLIHLLSHGILHLLGFDHEKPKMAEAMEASEISILKHFKISNPYS